MSGQFLSDIIYKLEPKASSCIFKFISRMKSRCKADNGLERKVDVNQDKFLLIYKQLIKYSFLFASRRGLIRWGGGGLKREGGLIEKLRYIVIFPGPASTSGSRDEN